MTAMRPYTARTIYGQGGFLRIQCLSASCAHQVQIGPRELIEAGHGDVHLDYAAKRMRCSRCHHLGAKVSVELAREERWP